MIMATDWPKHVAATYQSSENKEQNDVMQTLQLL
jgi:hypothetical protein